MLLCSVCVLLSICVRDLVDVVFFFKQKTAYEMRISDWSSDLCSSDLYAMIQLSSPMRVTPTSWAVPVLMVTYSRTVLPLPISRRVGSPEYFLSCGKIGRASCRERVCPYV